MENKIITLSYSNCDQTIFGLMTINLQEFLLGDRRSITKVKKVIKIIEKYNTDPEEWKIKESILEFINNFNEEYKGYIHLLEKEMLMYDNELKIGTLNECDKQVVECKLYSRKILKNAAIKDHDFLEKVKSIITG